jgi:hypothetical protein
MRARNIKPRYYTDAELEDCSIPARWLFPALWMLADRDGRLQDNPRQIKREVCPCDDLDINELLAELHIAGVIIRYQVNGGSYIAVVNFHKHQSPHHKEPSFNYPPPPESPEPTKHEPGKQAKEPKENKKRNTEARDRIWFEALKKKYPEHRREDQPEWAWKGFRAHVKNNWGKERKARFLEIWFALMKANASVKWKDEPQFIPGFGKFCKGKWKVFANESDGTQANQTNKFEKLETNQ